MVDVITELIQSFRLAPRVEWLSFSGEPSEDVLVFAQGVLRSALGYGRQDDGAWIAHYAYGCLSGYALEWFEHLDAAVRQDWSKLRPVLLEKFLPNRTPRNSSSRARVKVARHNGGVLGYMSPPTPGNMIALVSNAEEALVLDIPGAYGTVATIRMVARSGGEIGLYPLLGLESRIVDWWNFQARKDQMVDAHEPIQQP